MEYKGGIHGTDIANGATRFRLVVARGKPFLRAVIPAVFEGTMADAWDKLKNQPYVYAISPRPSERAKTAAIDVRVRAEKAPIGMAVIADNIQRVLGVWSELVSIEPLDPADLSVSRAPTEREKAEEAALEAGHGKGAGEGIGDTFRKALEGLRGMFLGVLVIGAAGLLVYGLVVRKRATG